METDAQQIEDLISFVKIYGEALRILTGGDRELGMEMLKQASDNLEIELPVIACNV